MTSFSPFPPLASRALASLRQSFEHTAAALAQSCANGGVLDARRLDQEQVPSYELALASAELLAAETVLAQLPPAPLVLDRRLALTCVMDAIGSVAERLHVIALDLDLDMTPLKALLASADVLELRRAVLGGRALNETGRLLCESHDEIGHIELGEELTLAQQQFRRIAAEVVAPRAEAIHRHDLIVPEELLQPLREMGVFGLSIPERFGGSAPDDRDDNLMMIVVTEALSEASLAAAGSLITRPEILSRALITGGTDEQKAHWLPKIACGNPLCGIAITEPDYGSDVASLQLKGTRTAGGWLLNGAKTWCTFAGKAGLIMVVTRTSPDRSSGYRGLSILLVEKPSYDGHAFTYQQDGGGRLVGKAIPTIGYRGMHSFDLSFEQFFVPDANVIGGEAGLGKGFYFTMAGMMGGRMQTAARASGIMRAALLAALRYAGDRKVFGAPLANYALTRAKLARMAARFVACRQLAYAVGRLLDQGGGRMEASLVKLFACRSAEWITREALQIYGGMGYAEESAVSRYFVDARVLSIFEGAEETLALKVIARSLLEDALKIGTQH
ncbi:MAG: acyl-CoA dehydrogenase [Hydrocarboniphaga sp.]|uniref:acyl-CoA dehydrogenase family protein n=1 Tax=Hydrocarboniphaga sp. TaxID=2033016 RepID=UPI0026139C03|nr:acyl-CoA dehydrogenase family protein [Hydrocarboniphaga sp.]MDB5969677.1 acyl-CoA dehydrogenase [Hydrocarboniphaga sp.]